jgi:preprotein translocase subunit SecD
MKRHYGWLITILIVLAICTWIALPISNGTSFDFNNDEEADWKIHQPLGLDLVGGLRILLQAQVPAGSYSPDELKETANNISRRVNSLGLSEATVQLQGENRILIELPGVTDPQEAVATIQQTALLEFVDFSGLGVQVAQLEGQTILTTKQLELQQARSEFEGVEANAAPVGIVNPLTGLPFETVVTGAALAAAAEQYDTQTGQWNIVFELNETGSDIFGPFTAEHVGEPMAIVLDGEVLSAPVIQSQLTDGGRITGDFDQISAQRLALQLRSGALPLPLGEESTEIVGATLGQESVRLSIQAGIIGVMIVLSFMLIYYRSMGIAADLALLVFIVLNLALFKLIPITLTLPAIAGFLISIGTAVDGNILIFERIKEEVRMGKPLNQAFEMGFDRAWASIRDSNTSTIIICAILFFFGQTPGASIVSAFAVTLALGLVLNLFTAIIVTRTFLSFIMGSAYHYIEKNAWTLGV